jgi:hypothetical protein
MIYVALAQTAVIAFLVWLMLREREASSRVLASFVKEFAEERHELLNRIAAPGIVLTRPQPPSEEGGGEPEADESDLVGVIQPPSESNGNA